MSDPNTQSVCVCPGKKHPGRIYCLICLLPYEPVSEPASTGEQLTCSCPCHKGESVICNCGGGFECEYINSIPAARPSGPSAPQTAGKCWKCEAGLPHEWQFCEPAPQPSAEPHAAEPYIPIDSRATPREFYDIVRELAAAPQPVSGDAPEWKKLPVGHWFFLDSPVCTNRYSVQERTDSGCTLVCSTPWHYDGAKTDMQRIADLHNSQESDPAPSPTPSVSTLKREPCFRGCTLTKDRKLCADKSGLMINYCGCDCHDPAAPSVSTEPSREEIKLAKGWLQRQLDNVERDFDTWPPWMRQAAGEKPAESGATPKVDLAFQVKEELNAKLDAALRPTQATEPLAAPAQGTPEPPKVDMPQLIAQEILDYAFRPVNGVWKLNFTTMKAIIQKYFLRPYFPPASQKEKTMHVELSDTDLYLNGLATDHIWIMETGPESHPIGIRLDCGDSGTVYLSRTQAKDLAEQLHRFAAPGSVPQAPDKRDLRSALEALAKDYKEEVRNAETSFAYMNAMEVLGVPQAEPPKEEKQK